MSTARKVRRFLATTRYENRCQRVGGCSSFLGARARRADVANRALRYPRYGSDGYLLRNLWSVEDRTGVYWCKLCACYHDWNAGCHMMLERR